MTILLICLAGAAVIFAVKALCYYLGVAGLLHYLEVKYNDVPETETLKRLTLEAAKNLAGKR